MPTIVPPGEFVEDGYEDEEYMKKSPPMRRENAIGIIKTNARGECGFANAPAARLAGVTIKEAQGFGWLKHVQADDRRLLREKLKRRPGARAFAVALRFVSAGGATAWARLILVPLHRVAPESTGYLIALTDTTPRQNLENRLAQARKMEAVGRLVGGVAHDFNNILTAISSHAGQLLEALGPDHPAGAVAVQIGKLAEHSAQITRQLLAVGRKQAMRPRRADINHVLNEMRDLVESILGEGIELRLDLEWEAGSVVIDLAQIQQVILDLATNARDAMSEGGSLTISTEKTVLNAVCAARHGLVPGDYVVLSVRDTGTGMDAEILQRVFEPFFTTKPPGRGTGLGLSTAYGIIRQSGGTVCVESAVQGSTFRIYLPRAGDGQAAAEPCAEQPKAQKTILLVEDNAAIRSLIRELLERHGYTVIEAGDAPQACAAAHQHRPVDLLLTDLLMPGMNGRVLAKKLRRRRPELKVIYMSGYSEDCLKDIEKDAIYLEKPFRPNVLSELIRKSFEKK